MYIRLCVEGWIGKKVSVWLSAFNSQIGLIRPIEEFAETVEENHQNGILTKWQVDKMAS